MIKLRIILFVAAVAVASTFAATFQLPGERTRAGSLEQQVSQETRDAMQDMKIESLQSMAAATASIASEAKDKLSLMSGAVIGFGALLTFLQIYQIRKK